MKRKDRPPEIDARAKAIWAETRLHVWPERYFLVSLPTECLPRGAALVGQEASRFAALILERDEVSLTIEAESWQGSSLRNLTRKVDGPFRSITFDVNIDLDVCGYLAPAAVLLARSGVSIIPQCAFLKDHLLVHEEHLALAVDVLEQWIKDCRSSGSL